MSVTPLCIAATINPFFKTSSSKEFGKTNGAVLPFHMTRTVANENGNKYFDSLSLFLRLRSIVFKSHLFQATGYHHLEHMQIIVNRIEDAARC